MAVAEVGDILDQPQGGAENSGNGETLIVIRKGDYDELLAESRSLTVGQSKDYGDAGHPDVRHVVSWDLKRTNAGLGVLTVRYGATDGDAENDDENEDVDDGDVISVKWSIRNVQQQLPLSQFYLDEPWSAASAPDGHQIAQWRQEPRKELYDAYQFLAPDGNVYELSDESKQVADKYKLGIESVMRFYPVVTRTKTYAFGMDPDKVGRLKIGEKLAYIDSPTETFGLNPGKWLCIQDEGELAADGTFVRTTGWMGCKTLDDNLYGGTSRWEPMHISDASGGSGNPGGSGGSES